MYEIYSTITRQMILSIINLASAKKVDLLVSITVQFLSFSLPFHFLHFFSLCIPLLFIPLMFIVNLTYIIKSTMIYVAGKEKQNKL